MSFFDNNKLYKNFEYPKEYIKVKELGLVDFEFWYLLTENQIKERIVGLNKRYPLRRLIPFAKRDDCDDIACFELTKDGTVQIIHDFASEGYEQKKEYNTFWDWFKDAIDEMISNQEL